MNKMKLKHYITFTKIDIIILISILVLIVSYIFIKLFSERSSIVLMEKAKSETIEISTMLINKSIYEIIYNSSDNFNDVLIINKNNNDEIVSIDFNNKIVNEKLYLLSDNILENISYLENGNIDKLNIKYFKSDDLIYYIPIGIIYNIPVLTDIGPKIPFKVSILGSVKTDIDTKVKEYGINNSLIEILINIDLNIQIILPFISENINIFKSIPVSSKIIQGKVPTYYGGLIKNSN